ncbi:hypothetical protein F5B20DRAFT_279312 [Whalleya microplaca]|nr:hypothetical protein F5B20DRAFT_279312 [Whalleya microplaca]
MFLHSGASLHGHEYSHRPAQPAPNAGQRRNPLLRSSFVTPINRASTYPPGTERSPNQTPPSNLKRPRPVSDYIPRVPDQVVRFQEPKCDEPPIATPEAMSEDESLAVSDSDVSRASSFTHRARRRAVRTSTTYLLAQPAPKLRTKQRIIHIRPKLLLQMQQLSLNQRPKPAIDVYPSSAFAGSLLAPLLKRCPRIARIKKELSVQDVMLVRSEDYSPRASESDSDGDEDSIKSRELLAVFSPLKSGDKTQIVLADGTVWVATPRSSGSACSCDFVSVDAHGNTTTARWVRKQVVTKSLPTTPTSNIPSLSKPSVVDYKFTFSIINPNHRRHPIFATLTSSSLDILDTYTTVSQSASRYPPTSPMLSSPLCATDDANGSFQRTTQQVEEWQKEFISISAIWVALRHGWVPNWKPTDFVSPCATPTSPTDEFLAARNRSLSMNSEITSKLNIPSPIGRRIFPMRTSDQSEQGDLPRRATSTGAAYLQKRRTLHGESSDQSNGSAERGEKPSRRAFSGDWDVGARSRVLGNSLGAVVDSPSDCPPPPKTSSGNSLPLAPDPFPNGRRAVSAYYEVSPAFFGPNGNGVGTDIMEKRAQRNSTMQNSSTEEEGSSARRGKHQRWKSMANWFKRRQGR